MSLTPVVALIGLTGLVGTAVLPSLLESNRITLRLLTTDPTAPALALLLAATPNSASVHRIDWASPESLAKAMDGVDVVVSTLKSRGEVAERWALLIEAAAKSGVTHYFPSEYGTDPTLSSRSFPAAGFDFKVRHKAEAEALGLKVWCIYTGMFLEGGISLRNGIDTAANVWELAPPGDVPFAFTSTRDLGPILIRCLLSIQQPALLPADGGLRVFSSCESWSSYAETWQQVTGHPVKKKWLTDAELQEGMANGPGGGFPAFVKVAGSEGAFDHSRGNVMELLERMEIGGKWEKTTMEVLARESLAVSK